MFPVLQGVGEFVKGCKVDPWGLYLAVGVGRGGGEGGEGGGTGVEDGFICDVSMFEVATGFNALVEEGMRDGLKGIVCSSGFEWSSDGSKIVFLGCRGNLDIRLIPEVLRLHMGELKRKLRTDPHLWSAYPIFHSMPDGLIDALSLKILVLYSSCVLDTGISPSSAVCCASCSVASAGACFTL